MGRRRALIGGLIAVAVIAAACADKHSAPPPPATAGAPVDPQPAVVTVSAPSGAIDVDPTAPVRVSAADGTLDTVAMVNDAGAVR